MARYFTSIEDCSVAFKINTDDMKITELPRVWIGVEGMHIINEDGVFEYTNRYNERVTFNVHAGDIVVKIDSLMWLSEDEDVEKNKSEYPYTEIFVLQDPVLKQNILSKKKYMDRDC